MATRNEIMLAMNFLAERYPEHSTLLILSGSHAYGMDHAESDIDIRGVFVAPSASLLGIQNVSDRFEGDASYDFVSHEFNKFVSLMCKNNPNILELVASLSDPSVLTRANDPSVVQLLTDIAPYCLSAKGIRSNYCGFANGQIKRMDRHGDADDPRRVKLIRHAFRVLDQADHLLRTGRTRVLLDAEEIERLNAYVDMENEAVVQLMEDRIAEISAIDSSIQEYPDLRKVNQMVIDWRKGHIT